MDYVAKVRTGRTFVKKPWGVRQVTGHEAYRALPMHIHRGVGKPRKSKFGGLERWWGVLTGLLLIAAWIHSAAGPALIIALSAATLLWTAFQAPVYCGAEVRGHGDGCRNNAHGLILGCHLRQHRWQKVKLLVVRRRVREFSSGLFTDAQHTIVTLAGVGSFVSGLVALVPGIAA